MCDMYYIAFSTEIKKYKTKSAAVLTLMKRFSLSRGEAMEFILNKTTTNDIERVLITNLDLSIRLEKLEKESNQRQVEYREQKVKRHNTKLEKYYQTMLEQFEASLKKYGVASYKGSQSNLFQTFHNETPDVIDRTNYVEAIQLNMEKWMEANNTSKIYDYLQKKYNTAEYMKLKFDNLFLFHHLELYTLMN
jgi:hypothetical protein